MSLATKGPISKAFDRIIGQCMDGGSIQQLLFSVDKPTRPSNVQDLIKTLLLKISRKYMMKVNIGTIDGLVNGTTGVLKRIDYGRLSDSDNIQVKASNSLSVTKNPPKSRYLEQLDYDRTSLWHYSHSILCSFS
ncbi:hypothetical protein CLU79DRAFT_836252 [Phycomyces nitens]|nr:hypothetical protein CLU79DRAFT_836252 [Phycomyces nitens]